ncbi:hypothetical protein [Xanthomonas campestris]|uniref:hypothetical protein n=1 Tax=Xanthomonas campestris TaxID=339 RepID=UPI001C842933|nr:hypothetical protein [Xanthomonas campestris]MCC5051994.1 hypothetical protein [Xanthomonas campestris pv. aberrans]MDM7683147.1 hypothetical protein [Xanthomonas campestris pv. campestris]MDM7710475.1 hypothetical protein [Xanthomonas campestris pv. campestris]MDO0858528.1 hypothetical protein [Xanthomonas campestris pv. campestris]MEA9472466.1 hypothetical protein [Xanthomonas campestris]
MNNPLDRLIFALAAMELTSGELAYLEVRLRTLPPKTLEKLVHSQMHAQQKYQDESRHQVTLRGNSSTVGDRVERLLKVDARLSTMKAVDIFSGALIREKLLRADQIPPLSKKAFNTWVDRISTIVEPKELLRIATLIRNRLAHEGNTDWSRIEN